MDINDLLSATVDEFVEALEGEPALETTRMPSSIRDGLDTPILTTSFDRLKYAFEGVRPRALSTSCSIAVEAGLAQEFRTIAQWSGPVEWATESTLYPLVERACRRSPAISPESASVAYHAFTRGLQQKGFPSCPQPTASASTRSHWSGYIWLRRPLRTLARATSEGRQRVVHSRMGGRQLYLTPAFFALAHEQGLGFVVGPLNLYQSAVSCVQESFGYHLAVDAGYRGPDAELLHTEILWLASWQRRVIVAYGTNGFPVAKAPESMYKARAGETGRLQLDGWDAVGNMGEKYKSKETALTDPRPCLDLVSELISRARSVQSTEIAAQLSGALNQCGYPIMDPTTSAAKSRRIGTAPPMHDMIRLHQAVCLFSHLVLKNYIQRHGYWPPLEPGPGFARTRLGALYRSRSLLVDDGSYPLEDWDHACIGKIAEFEKWADYLRLLADKASFEGMSKRTARYRGEPVGTEYTKLLHHTVMQTDIDTWEESEVLSLRLEPPEVRGANLAPKEKEYKPEARMFTILHPSIRRPLSIAQENVKSGIFPYLPYTSMAMGPVELARYLHSVTALSDHHLKVEVDLSSWNLRFEEMFSEAVGFRMDKMFAVQGKFGQSHAFFRRSEFCVTVAGMLVPQLEGSAPRDSDSDTLWHDDGSGKEGIEQRFWTVLTILIIYLAFWGEPVTFSVMGQGDNQTVVIDLSRIVPSRRTEVASRLMDKISTTATELNHEAKVEEFMMSLTLLTYAKNFYEDGREIPGWVKWVSRIKPDIDEVLPSLPTTVGSIMSSALSAGRKTHNPLYAWWAGLMVAGWEIQEWYHDRAPVPASYTPGVEELSDPQLSAACMIVPTSLGGFPVPPPTSFLVTGNPDPLSEGLACLRLLYPVFLPARGLSHMLTQDGSYRSAPSLATLVDDPYGIPLQTPSTGAGELADAVRHRLAGAGNNAIRSLASSHQTTSAALKDSLVASRPIFPEICRDLYAISSLGRAETILGKFERTSTFVTMLGSSAPVRQALTRERERTSAMISWLSRSRTAYGAGCITSEHRSSDRAARHLRSRWGVQEGCIEGLDLAQPFDYALHRDLGEGVLAIRTPLYDLERQGPVPPYFGSATKEKRAAAAYEIESDTPTTDLARLVAIASAGSFDPRLHALYSSIAGSRTDVPLALLMQMFPNTQGGTLAHRYDSLRANARIAPVGLPTARSYVAIDTDNIQGVSATARDFNFPAQSFMSYAVIAHQVEMSLGLARTSRVFRIGVSASDLIELVEPPREGPPTIPTIPPARDNPLVHIPVPRVMRARIPRGELIRDPSRCSAERLLTAAMVSEYLSTGGGRLAADTGRPMAPFLDIASASGASARTIVKSAAQAVALGTIWSMVWVVGQQEHRHTLTVALDNVSHAVSAGLYHVLLHPGVFDRRLVEEGILLPASGGRHRPAQAHFSRALRSLALRHLSTPEEVSRLAHGLLIPSLLESPPYLLEGKLALAVTAWWLHVSGSVDGLGVAKRFVLGLVRQARDANTVSDLSVLQGISHLVGSFTAGIPESIVRLSRGIPSVPLDPAGCARACRGGVPVGRIFTSSRLFSGGQPSTAVMEPTVSADFGIYRPHGDETAMPLDTILLLQSDRPYVGRSSIGRMWYPLLPRSGPVLVVGTGSGGIQRVLASMGIESRGLDLVASLDPGSMVSRTWPADTYGIEGAQYADAMLTSDGDWLGGGGRDSLHEQRWSTIVVDIEPSPRGGLEMLGPLLHNEFFGSVLLKLRANRAEAAHAYSCLRASHGVRHVSLYPLAPPLEGTTTSWVVQYRQFGRIALADRGVLYRIDSISQGNLPSVRDPQIGRLQISMASGGLVSAHSITELRDRLQDELVADRPSRADTTHASLLHAAKILAAILITLSVRDDPDWPSQLAQLIRDAPGGSYGRIVVPQNDDTVVYFLRHIAPSLLGHDLGSW